MKKFLFIIFIVLPIICLCQKEDSIKDRFINKVLHSTWRQKSYWIPLTIKCDDTISNIVVNNSYLYQYFYIKHSCSTEEYISIMYPVLYGKDTMNICIEDIKNTIKGNCLVSYLNHELPDSVCNLELNYILLWAFDNDRYLIKDYYFEALVKILFENNVAIRFGDEDTRFFYDKENDI